MIVTNEYWPDKKLMECDEIKLDLLLDFLSLNSWIKSKIPQHQLKFHLSFKQ